MAQIEQQYFKISELVRAGYPRNTLEEIAHTPGQRIAFRVGGKGPWRFDIRLLKPEMQKRMRYRA